MINLLVSYYLVEDEKRQFELDHCFLNNIQNPFINKIHCFISPNDYENTRFRNEKIIYNIVEDRITFFDVLKYSYDAIPENEIVVIANSDLYYDSTLRFVLTELSNNDLFAITRWGADGNIIQGTEIFIYPNAHCSQDTWIFRSKIKNLDKMDCNFNFGVNGCDNRIAYEFLKAGYILSNPCIDIFSYHVHTSGVRANTSSLQGEKLYIKPTLLNDKERDLYGKN